MGKCKWQHPVGYGSGHFWSPTLINNFQTPNGSHAAVYFNGGSGIALNVGTLLNKQNLSIFVVGSLTTTNQSAEFISNYSYSGQSDGWADGISDGTPNSPKWYTGPDSPLAPLGGNTLPNTMTPGSGENNAYLLIDTISSPGGVLTKTATLANTWALASSNTVSGTDPGYLIPYSGGEYPALGYLSNAGNQRLTGDIAEILVYDNSVEGFNANAVEAYLNAEFFSSPEPSSLISGLSMFAIAAIGLAIKRRRVLLGHAKIAIIAGLVAGLSLVANNAHAASVPPTAGLVLGLDASQNIGTTGSTVTSWGSVTGGPNLINPGTSGGTRTLIQNFQTPNGLHAAVAFDTTGGIGLNQIPALNSQTLSIFVVGSLTGTNQSAEFISNFDASGWADGISDSSANSLKFYTTAGDTLSGTAPVTLTPGIGANNAYLLIDTINTNNQSSNNKTVTALNGYGLANSQTASDLAPVITYNGGEYPAIGYLSQGGQGLLGDIAEVLVYDNSAPGFNANAVESYLNAEFFSSPEPSSVISGLSMFAIGAIGLLIKRRRRAAAR